MNSIIELCEQSGDLVLHDSTKGTYAMFFKSVFLKTKLKTIKWQRKYVPELKRLIRVVDLSILYKNLFDQTDYPSVSEVRDILLNIYLVPETKYQTKIDMYVGKHLYPYLFLFYTKDISVFPCMEEVTDVKLLSSLYKYLIIIDKSYLDLKVNLKT